MPNKPRPRCPECEESTAMDPLYVDRPRGETRKRAGDTFYCNEHDILAKGRPEETQFLR